MAEGDSRGVAVGIDDADVGRGAGSPRLRRGIVILSEGSVEVAPQAGAKELACVVAVKDAGVFSSQLGDAAEDCRKPFVSFCHL